MSKECNCIKDYTVTTRDYLGNKQHGPIYNQIIFNEGKKCYYRLIDGTYYISAIRNYLRDISRYNTYVEELSEKQFKEHFNERNKNN